ncbi:MAG: S-layer homology domain-containing protein [Oscillospiraceae bacterium]|nr:S-layer homology domain-containing protein [Oscillospiraceae bacterium]
MKKRLCSWLLVLTMLLGLFPSAAFAAEEPPVPFAAKGGEEMLTVLKSDTDYSYTVVTEYDENWNPIQTEERAVDLYVVCPDTEVSEVTLDFGEEERIAYTYDANGNYLGACGDYGDGTIGRTTANVTDLTAYVRVQTPYDANWRSEFLYAVAFDLPSPAPYAPFAALFGETRLPVSKSETPYTYTVVTEYDANWNPIRTEERAVDLYVIRPDTQVSEVTLDFGEEERIAYTYDANGNYLGACGDYGDGTIGRTTANVTDLTAYVRVQTPYDANWQSEFLYAVAIDAEEEENDDPAPSTVSVEELLANIAAGYTDDSDEWVVLDMAAYEDTVSGGQSKTSDTAKQIYIDSAIASVTADGAEEGDYAKAILALQAIGADPQKLYPKNSGSPVSAAAGLKSMESHSSSAWVAPYTLAALNQGDYGTQDLERSILSAVLGNQAEDGSWSEWGDSIQTTANMIAGLAFYYGKEDAATAAVDKAVSFLSRAQKEDGSFDAYGTGADSNTAAMVVIALSALGVDPDTDARFIKNETSALDGLLAFALTDHSGFGYTNNAAVNSYSTEQAFRALVAANAVAQTGKAYNVYDFSTNEVAPAYAGGKPGGGSSSGGGGSVSGTIKVYFTLKTHQTTWISRHRVTVDKGADVGELFRQVLDSRSGFSYVDKGGYISSITKDGTTWEEFNAGPNSGWKYTVNGTAPGVGMNDRTLKSGDEVVWYYVSDYTADPTPDEGGSTKPSDSGKEEDKEEPKPDTPEVQEPLFAFADVDGHWAKDAIRFVYGKGLMVGTGETTFEPETTGSRGMIMTILHNLDGNPDFLKNHSFPDVKHEMYYSNAISWAVSVGIIAGYGNGTFGPEDDVTREQLAVILRQYAKVKGYDVSKSAELSVFVDSDRVSPWAREALEWACGQGLISGKGGGVLDPGGRATRAEVAAILMHFMEKVME